MSGPSRLPGSLPSTLHSSSLKIGDFFTPSEWARFAVRTHGIFPAWMNGKSVFDPSMGSGALLQALVEEGLERGYKLRELPLKSLYGCEKNRQYRRQAIEIFSRRCGMDMSDNFFPGDFLLCRSRPFDIILGNPPWMNFTALPEDYREELKVYFHTYSLVESRRSLLLGSSRVDIAALIINKAIAEHLVPGGRAVFFAPLSLLLGSGAHEAFRRFHVNGTDFALCSVHDFRAAQVFPNVSTRYGLMAFERNSLTEYPVPWFSLENGEWQKLSARPLTGRTAPLSILTPSSSGLSEKMRRVRVPRSGRPRQGVNTGGANALFFFDSCTQSGPSGSSSDGPADTPSGASSNRPAKAAVCTVNGNIPLPSRFVYPLITHANFQEKNPLPRKWVLLPYGPGGKPLSREELEKEPLLRRYLESLEPQLRKRRGRLLNSQIQRGLWWSLLGVGSYSFQKYKVVWEASGRRQFRPRVFKGMWQANQSMQAFIPCPSLKEARRICSELSQDWVEEYLLSLRMEGTMNWAQPGKIQRLLNIEEG